MSDYISFDHEVYVPDMPEKVALEMADRIEYLSMEDGEPTLKVRYKWDSVYFKGRLSESRYKQLLDVLDEYIEWIEWIEG